MAAAAAVGAAKSVAISAAICGAVATGATVTVGVLSGQIDDVASAFYFGMDSFCNGAVTGAISAILPGNLLGKLPKLAQNIATLALGTLGGIGGYAFDDFFDRIFGYDEGESEKTPLHYFVVGVASLGSSLVAMGVNHVLSSWADKIMSGVSKKTIDRYIDVLLSENRIPQAVIEQGHFAMRQFVRAMTEFPGAYDFLKKKVGSLLIWGTLSSATTSEILTRIFGAWIPEENTDSQDYMGSVAEVFG